MNKPTVEMSSITSFLAGAFGEFGGLIQLAEGEESRAFAFRAKAEPYVLRINTSMDDFQKDAYVYSTFEAPALPIPEIIRIGAFDKTLSYCVSRKAPGITLQDLPERDLPAIAGPVAAVLDAISAADVQSLEGFGRFGPNGIGRFPSWHAFLMAVTDPEQYDWFALPSRGMRGAVMPLLEELARCASQCPEIRCLVHGDFGSNNVLVDGNRVSAVIDWSEALIGDPLYDVANIFFWRPWLPCMEYQARFFEQRDPWLPQSLRLRAYQLRIGLDQLYQSTRDGDGEDAAWALTRCLDIAGSAR